MIDPSIFKFSQLEHALSVFKSTQTPKVKEVLYVTCDEYACNAVYYISDKSQFSNAFQAALFFMYKSFCVLAEDSPEPVELCLEENQHHKAVQMTQDEWEKDTSLIINEFLQKYDEALKGRLIKCGDLVEYSQLDLTPQKGRLAYRNIWGLFVDRKIIPDPLSFKLPIQGQFVDAVSFVNEWNEKAFLMETTEEYVYFDWSTGV